MDEIITGGRADERGRRERKEMKCIFLQTVGISPEALSLSLALEDRRRACEHPLTFVFPGSENGLWAKAKVMTNARAITMTDFDTE